MSTPRNEERLGMCSRLGEDCFPLHQKPHKHLDNCWHWSEGVAAPLEPSAEESFIRWVEENKFTVIPDETPHRQWQLIFAEFHAAAVSKNLQEELANESYMNLQLGEQVQSLMKMVQPAEALKARIFDLEKEIAAIRETKI